MGEAPTSKKIDVSNLKGGRHALRAFLIPVAMPHLPKSLAPVRSAVVSLLRPRHHFSNLYTATDIAEALNVAANVSGNPAIDRGVDASLVLRAFAFDGMDEIFLSLKDVFGYWRNPHGLYVRKPVRAARNDGGVLVIGRFATIEEARSSRMLAQKLLANME